MLVDGCVWEVRGESGGHLGVAVERFTAVDMDALAAQAEEDGITPDPLSGGRQRWHIPGGGNSPSGAVIVGGSNDLVVVRLESFSDSEGRDFLSDVVDGDDQFFRAVGDAAERAEP